MIKRGTTRNRQKDSGIQRKKKRRKYFELQRYFAWPRRRWKIHNDLNNDFLVSAKKYLGPWWKGKPQNRLFLKVDNSELRGENMWILKWSKYLFFARIIKRRNKKLMLLKETGRWHSWYEQTFNAYNCGVQCSIVQQEECYKFLLYWLKIIKNSDLFQLLTFPFIRH